VLLHWYHPITSLKSTMFQKWPLLLTFVQPCVPAAGLRYHSYSTQTPVMLVAYPCRKNSTDGHGGSRNGFLTHGRAQTTPKNLYPLFVTWAGDVIFFVIMRNNTTGFFHCRRATEHSLWGSKDTCAKCLCYRHRDLLTEQCLAGL
jgi:hypothetical protein